MVASEGYVARKPLDLVGGYEAFQNHFYERVIAGLKNLSDERITALEKRLSLALRRDVNLKSLIQKQEPLESKFIELLQLPCDYSLFSILPVPEKISKQELEQLIRTARGKITSACRRDKFIKQPTTSELDYGKLGIYLLSEIFGEADKITAERRRV